MSLSYRRVPPKHAVNSAVSSDEILRLWKRGLDTYEIAVKLDTPEHQVERHLHEARDGERRAAEWNWPPEPAKGEQVSV